jgi:hypothetical protein
MRYLGLLLLLMTMGAPGQQQAVTTTSTFPYPVPCPVTECTIQGSASTVHNCQLNIEVIATTATVLQPKLFECTLIMPWLAQTWRREDFINYAPAIKFPIPKELR